MTTIYKTKDPNLKASINDARAHATMLGSGETYLGAFAVFLSASTIQIGLLATLPQLIGALFQYLGVWLMERLASRKKLIVTLAALQSVCWIFIAVLPFIWLPNSQAVLLLIALVILHHIFAGLNTPAWNSLIGDLVPPAERGRFFGKRTQETAIFSFIALLSAGATLAYFNSIELAAWGFCLVYLTAFIARALSAYFLAQHEDTKFSILPEEIFSFIDFIKRAPKSNFAKFVFFVGSMNFAVALASPYYTPYLLKDLGMPYLEFTLITGALVASQYLTLQNWGHVADKIGYKKIMRICAWGINLTPLLWLISTNFWFIMFIQIQAGMIWAGYNLGAANFLFDAVSPPKRARCAAYLGIINGIAIFLGSLTGAYLVTEHADSISISTLDGSASSAFLTIFLLSAILRALVSIVLFRLFKEVREVEHMSHKQILLRVAHLRAFNGLSLSLLTGFKHRKRGS